MHVKRPGGPGRRSALHEYSHDRAQLCDAPKKVYDQSLGCSEARALQEGVARQWPEKEASQRGQQRASRGRGEATPGWLKPQ